MRNIGDNNIENTGQNLKSQLIKVFAGLSFLTLLAGIIVYIITSSILALIMLIVMTTIIFALGSLVAGGVEHKFKHLSDSIEVVSEVKNVETNPALDIDAPEITRCLNSYAKGNFNIEVGKFPDRSINDSFAILKRDVLEIKSDINNLLESVSSGKLGVRIDTSKYQGSWADLASSVNLLVEEFMLPIQDVTDLFEKMSEGNMHSSLARNYKGDFGNLKKSIESHMGQNNAYLKEITRVLGELSNKNFTAEITDNFAGDYEVIKTSINSFANIVNELLAEISSSADSMYGNAHDIASSSRALEEGSSQQGTEVDALIQNLADIGAHAHENSKTAATANNLTQKTQEKAALGEVELKEMQKAIEDINVAASSISKVIKVIDDIAFQTNLLALNAAVEAARAGQHGKGFAVVAEEVRNLANRSQNAAKETGNLIAGSIEKAAEGTKIANQTASTLSEIIEQVIEISTLINGVAASSEGQESAVKQISVGVEKISEIAKNNSTVSERTAIAAESLNSQTEIFKRMMSSVKIRKDAARKSLQHETKEIDIVNLAKSPKVEPTKRATAHSQPPKPIARPNVNTPPIQPKQDIPKPITPIKKEAPVTAVIKETDLPQTKSSDEFSVAKNSVPASHEALLKEIHADLDSHIVSDGSTNDAPAAVSTVPKPVSATAKPIPAKPLDTTQKAVINGSSNNNTGIKGSKAAAPDFSHIYDKQDFGKF
ncbi:MAG: methyl-accepting chemotaxis protein [Defluviitaleaceae bacterium]|nr:methyl-accepting chemotaxis protein [Defluviitaleaceae bacterium]